MSNKEFNSMIDFQLILDELEKISFENPDAGIGLSSADLSSKIEQLKKEAAKEAKEDLDSIFKNSVRKNVESLDGIPEPLSKVESEAFDEKYDETIQNINLLKRKMEIAKSILKKKIENENGYTLDLTNRKDTAKAARRFFRESKSGISYEDYLIAREYKKSQNEREAFDFFKED